MGAVGVMPQTTKLSEARREANAIKQKNSIVQQVEKEKNEKRKKTNVRGSMGRKSLIWKVSTVPLLLLLLHQVVTLFRTALPMYILQCYE
jgi:hypothetical protein